MAPETCLARFAQGPVPEGPARAVLRLSLLDWAACGIAGAGEEVTRILRAEAAPGACTLIGGGSAAPASAALINGATSHALDYDDTHFAHIGHPSVAVIPAALAVAEDVGASMEALIDAALLGAEASVRIGLWLGRAHYQTGFHMTATAGAFGATLAAARLMGLSEGQTVMALGLAATRAAGLKSQFGTMGKPYNAGIAAETGVSAARLAARGMSSSTSGLSGPQGFGATHHGVGDETAFDDLGETWLFEGVSHKFHACCHGLHAMLEALSGLELDPATVERVTVRTHPRWLRVCDIAAPGTGLEVKFSYRMTAAMRLAGVDTADIASFSDATASDPALIALRDRVEVLADDSLSEMQAEVTVTAAGARHVRRHDLEVPLPLDARTARVRAKARALIGPRAEALWGAIGAGEGAAFAALLQA